MPKWLQIIVAAATVAPQIIAAGKADGTVAAISVGIDASNQIAQAVITDPQEKAEAQAAHDLATTVFGAFASVFGAKK